MTPSQESLLRTLATVGPVSRYGSGYNQRIGKRLVEKGWAHWVFIDPITWCRITSEGRQALWKVDVQRWDRAAKANATSREGCTCLRDKHRKEFRCTREIMRCNGRIARWQEDMRALGPRPEMPVGK